MFNEVVLDVFPSSSHTERHCADMIVNVLDSYGISLESVSAITTDNTSACTTPINHLNSILSSKTREGLPYSRASNYSVVLFFT
jgi:hypothetical protein